MIIVEIKRWSEVVARLDLSKADALHRLTEILNGCPTEVEGVPPLVSGVTP